VLPGHIFTAPAQVTMFIGGWRGGNDQIIVVLRFERESRMKMHIQSTQSGVASALWDFTQYDVGDIVWDWRIQDSVLKTRFNGVESTIFTGVLRLQSLVGLVPPIGDVATTHFRFLDESTFELVPGKDAMVSEKDPVIFRKIE
jgi:hypothetical protein